MARAQKKRSAKEQSAKEHSAKEVQRKGKATQKGRGMRLQFLAANGVAVNDALVSRLIRVKKGRSSF